MKRQWRSTPSCRRISSVPSSWPSALDALQVRRDVPRCASGTNSRSERPTSAAGVPPSASAVGGVDQRQPARRDRAGTRSPVRQQQVGGARLALAQRRHRRAQAAVRATLQPVEHREHRDEASTASRRSSSASRGSAPARAPPRPAGGSRRARAARSRGARRNRRRPARDRSAARCARAGARAAPAAPRRRRACAARARARSGRARRAARRARAQLAEQRRARAQLASPPSRRRRRRARRAPSTSCAMPRELRVRELSVRARGSARPCSRCASTSPRRRATLRRLAVQLGAQLRIDQALDRRERSASERSRRSRRRSAPARARGCAAGAPASRGPRRDRACASPRSAYSIASACLPIVGSRARSTRGHVGRRARGSVRARARPARARAGARRGCSPAGRGCRGSRR